MNMLCLEPNGGHDCSHYAGAAHITDAVVSVLAERRRQVTAEGYSIENDDALGCSELARAAASYLCRTDALMLDGTRVWPPGWDFKPADYRRILVKACALALAELERFDRAEKARDPLPDYSVHQFVDLAGGHDLDPVPAASGQRVLRVAR